MEQFVLFFQAPVMESPVDLSPAQQAEIEQSWQNYIGGIAAQGKFLGTQRLAPEKSFVGQYSSESTIASQAFETIGFLTIKADDIQEAKALAASCPIVHMGGQVEVRPIIPFEL